MSKMYGLNSAEYIKCLFIDYLLSKTEESIIGNEFMYGVKRKLVDLVILHNKKATAIEIKSNNDSLKRLEGQIQECKKIFDYVLVVTTERYKNQIFDRTSDDIGIYIINNDFSIEKIRQPRLQQKKDKVELLYSINAQYLSKLGNYSSRKYNADEIREFFTTRTISHVQEILLAYLSNKYTNRFKLFMTERGIQTHIEDLCLLSSSFEIE